MQKNASLIKHTEFYVTLMTNLLDCSPFFKSYQMTKFRPFQFLVLEFLSLWFFRYSTSMELKLRFHHQLVSFCHKSWNFKTYTLALRKKQTVQHYLVILDDICWILTGLLAALPFSCFFSSSHEEYYQFHTFSQHFLKSESYRCKNSLGFPWIWSLL